MAGKPVTTTFSQVELAKIDTVARRLSLTRQQIVRYAVKDYLSKLDLFELTGGRRVGQQEQERTGY